MTNVYKKENMAKLQEILGDVGDNAVRAIEKISPDFAKYIVEFGYGDLYQRNVLTDKMRELAAVSNLMGQGITGLPLKAHLNGMLNVGWTKEEIIEVIIFLFGYNGFPTSLQAIQLMHEIAEEREK